MNIDDEKSQMDYLKVQNIENRVALFGDFRSENRTFCSKSKIKAVMGFHGVCHYQFLM